MGRAAGPRCLIPTRGTTARRGHRPLACDGSSSLLPCPMHELSVEDNVRSGGTPRNRPGECGGVSGPFGGAKACSGRSNAIVRRFVRPGNSTIQNPMRTQPGLLRHRSKIIEAGLEADRIRDTDLGCDSREAPPWIRHPLYISIQPGVKLLELALPRRAVTRARSNTSPHSLHPARSARGRACSHPRIRGCRQEVPSSCAPGASPPRQRPSSAARTG